MQRTLKERYGAAQSRGVEEALEAFFALHEAGQGRLEFTCCPDEWTHNTFHISPEAKAKLQRIRKQCGPMYNLQNITYSALAKFLAKKGS